MKFILSRIDAIGDVVLTLPLAGILKKYFPESTVFFFGRTYTQPIINTCEHVDGFINYDEFKILTPTGKKKFLSALQADTIIHVFPRYDIARASKAAGIPNRIGTKNRIYHWFTCNKLVSLSR